MDPRWLFADYVAEQGEGGQPTGLFGHTLVQLVQKVLRGREENANRERPQLQSCSVVVVLKFY